MDERVYIMRIVLELNDKQLEVMVNALYQFETNKHELYDIADQLRYTIQNMTTMQAIKDNEKVVL